MLRNNSRLYHIILFDGYCVLCNNSVGIILKFDPLAKTAQPLFKMAALQSPAGQDVMKENSVPSEIINIAKSLSSVILITKDNEYYIESDAALRIMLELKFPWPIVGWIGLLFPKLIRDFGYRVISKNRYKWFGTKDECTLPPNEHKSAFL